MAQTGSLLLGMDMREVELDYPGSKGVIFQDALISLKNNGTQKVDRLGLDVTLFQDGKELYSGPVEVGGADAGEGLLPGEKRNLSFFGMMQKKAPGFASKVNLFGYKVALNWDYTIEAHLEGEGISDNTQGSWSVRWSAAEDAKLIKVDIGIA